MPTIYFEYHINHPLSKPKRSISLPLQSCQTPIFPTISLLLNQLLKERFQNQRTLLGFSSLSPLIIHIRNSKSGLVALGPLKVIHQTPSQVAAHIGALLNRGRHGANVIAEIVGAESIFQNVGVGDVIFAEERSAVFGYVD